MACRLPASIGRPAAVLMLAALALTVLVGACAVEDRAEALYYRQHRAAAALADSIVAAETEDPALATRLYHAEDALDAACDPLRQAGYRRFNGESVDDELRWRILDSLDACTAEAERTEALLRRLDPATARFYLDAPRISAATESAAPTE